MNLGKGIMLQIFIIILSKFPLKLYHYAHHYAQNQLIILIIFNFTGEFLQLFYFAIKNFNNIL